MSSQPVLSLSAFNSWLILVNRNTVALKWNNFAKCCDFVALMKGALVELHATATDVRHTKGMHAPTLHERG